MTRYEIMLETLTRFSDLALMTGFVSLFSSALPAASLLGIICAFVDVRGDGLRMLGLQVLLVPG